MKFNSFISFATTLIPSFYSSLRTTTTVVDDMEFVMERLVGGWPTIRGVSSVNPRINEFSPDFTSGLGQYSNGEQLSLYSSGSDIASIRRGITIIWGFHFWKK